MRGDYRYLAASREGFIQQVATSYVNRGYRFFVPVWIPEHKTPELIDEKLIGWYGIAMDSGKRFRRKEKGLANVQYIRFGRFALLLATLGKHEFFQGEAANIRDCSKVPIIALGYSIKYVQGGNVLKQSQANPNGQPERDRKHRVRVQIARDLYKQLSAELVGQACCRREDWFRWRFWNLGFEPYAPVRKQMLELLRRVNSKRRASGLSVIPAEVIRFRRRIVKPFGPVVEYPSETAEVINAAAQTAWNR